MATMELAVFDLSGTTVVDNDDVTRCLRQTLAEMAGLEISLKEANTMLGRSKDVGLAEVLTNHGRPIGPQDPFVVQMLHDFDRRIIQHYQTDPSFKEMAGASAVFSELKSMGIKTAVDTGFSIRVAGVVIERMGWQKAGLLDAWTSCDQVRQGRPAPFMIHHLMEQLDVTDVGRVIKVGDAPSDIEMGRNARCGLTVGVLNGSHGREELAAHHPDALIPDITHLPDLVRS